MKGENLNMNKFITKIIGASLAIAMMIGGAIGINAAKEAKRVYADDTIGTINFGSASGSTNVNAASKTGDDNLGNTWTITTVGTTSFTPNANYAQIGSSSKPATSITFTTTLDDEQTITAFSAKFGGFSGTAGSIALKVGDTTIGTGSLNASSDVTVSNSSNGVGTVLTVTVTGISKGVKAYYISYTYSSSTQATYSVTYDSNGATSGTVPVDDGEYTSGDTVTVLGNTGNLAKTDYTFGGWTDGEHEYQVDGTFDISANVTLYAVWNTENGFDYLNRDFTGINNGGIYGDWSAKEGQSGAIYAGQSGGENNSIQLRSKNNNSGVVSTASGGNVKKVSVIWESDTQLGRTLNVYGKNTAYSSATDLYNANTSGTLLGTIVYGESTSYTFTSDYRYVGVRSDDGALFLTELHFKWEVVQLNPRVEFSPSSLTLKTNQTNGATVTALVEDVANPTYSWVANDNNVILENTNAAMVTIKPNTNIAANSTVTLTVGGTEPNLVETIDVTIEIPEPGETAGTAYTIAQAKAAIAASANDIENVYVTGIVSKVDGVNLSTRKATYWISDDGTTGNQFEIYNGKYVDNADFALGDQIIAGDEVIVFGTISKEYNSLNNSKIISIDLAPRVTSVTLTPNAVTVDLGDDGNIADLFTNIVINQEAGSNKTANDIVWTSDDEEVFAVVDDVQYLACDTHRASTTIHAFLNNREFASATVNVFNANVHVIGYNLPEEWRKVTDPSTLVAGDKVILTGVKTGVTYAAGTYIENGTNIQSDTVHTLTVSGNTVTGVVNTMIYTLEAGTVEGSLAFKDSNGDYLYAASSSANQLKASNTKNNNSSFVLNANGTVVAQGSNSRKYMRYNNDSSSNLFSCYAANSTTGTIVTFYKYSTGTAELDLFNLSAIRTAHEDENGAYIRLGASLSEEDWAAMDSAFGIAGYGVMLIRETTLETTGFDSIEELYNSESENKAKLSNRGKNSETAPQDFSVAAKINISDDSDRAVIFCAATYVKASNGAIYFINETRGSLVGLL